MAKVRFMPREEEALRDAAKTVAAILGPEAGKEPNNAGRPLASRVASLFRPYVLAAVDPARASSDGRARKWSVQMEFWEISEGLERGELLAESDPEEVVGFWGAIALIREYALDVHRDDIKTIDALPEFAPTTMDQRLGGLRPAITKGGGTASLRVYYKLNKIAHMCKVIVERA